jgi:transposase
MVPDDGHDCRFRGEVQRLAAELEAAKSELAALGDVKSRLDALERRTFGRKSEKMPPMQREVEKDRPAEPEAAKRRRRERAAAKAALHTEVESVPVPAEARCCTACGNDRLKTVGNGTPSVVYDYVAAHFRRRIFRRETLSCSCGDYIVTAPTPEKVFDRSPYTPAFVAHLVVAKCEDAIPIYRLEKQFERAGIPLARSTMNDLVHRAAELLAPLYTRIPERVRESEIVYADETTLKMQSSGKKAFVWVFLTDKLTSFVFSPGRSGDVPAEVLGDSTGELMVDAYTGYNKVTSTGRRRRSGCLAHARRHVFDAKDDPAAGAALELIRQIYVVEDDARVQGIEGTDAHLALRARKTRPLFARLLVWARKQARSHGPKTPLGKASRYITKNRRSLTRFLHVANLPPDNNRSERALRRVALGRKNYLFVGHEKAGQNMAGLMSLLASCTQNRVNPSAYLEDVLVRIGEETDVDALLPDRWRPRPS